MMKNKKQHLYRYVGIDLKANTALNQYIFLDLHLIFIHRAHNIVIMYLNLSIIQ